MNCPLEDWPVSSQTVQAVRAADHSLRGVQKNQNGNQPWQIVYMNSPAAVVDAVPHAAVSDIEPWIEKGIRRFHKEPTNSILDRFRNDPE